MNNAKYSKKSIIRFLLISGAIALVASLFYINTIEFTTRWLVDFLKYGYLYSFLVSATLYLGIVTLIGYSRRRYSWLKQPVKRLLFDLTAVVSYTFVTFSVLLVIFLIYVWKSATWDTLSWSMVFKSSFLTVLISIGVTAIFNAFYFLEEWKRAAVEAEKLKSDYLASQYQTLKNQLNPHFLFNALNTLSNLVYEDANLANEFIKKLSDNYRYILDVQEDQTVALHREWKFCKDFLELQKIRFGDKLNYEWEEVNDNRHVLPLALQLLIENAIKHNVATRENPLQLRMYLKNDCIVVENSLQPRKTNGDNSNIGLENIKRRLSYFTDTKMDIFSDDTVFRVGVPLINPAT